MFIDLDSILVHKQAKKELGQYPDILTSHLVSKPYMYIFYNVVGGGGVGEERGRNLIEYGTGGQRGKSRRQVFPVGRKSGEKCEK